VRYRYLETALSLAKSVSRNTKVAGTTVGTNSI
jgi:hypothetical protein